MEKDGKLINKADKNINFMGLSKVDYRYDETSNVIFCH